jgi:hypothetical protein
METGSELSKTVATFIVQKMLLDEMGLTYVCATAERFYAVRRPCPQLKSFSDYCPVIVKNPKPHC